MKRVVKIISLCACAVVLAAGVLAGCASGASSANEGQQANRSYMSQVNEIVDELGVDLDSFVDAVSRGDVVNMRTQADNAFKALDKLGGLEVPEDLSDIQKSYADGTGKLREALNGYIDLYTEISSGTFDQSTYDERIADIQKLYDEGVALLKQGDESAASKE